MYAILLRTELPKMAQSGCEPRLRPAASPPHPEYNSGRRTCSHRKFPVSPPSEWGIIAELLEGPSHTSHLPARP